VAGAGAASGDAVQAARQAAATTAAQRLRHIVPFCTERPAGSGRPVSAEGADQRSPSLT
jgi:hypothetical protein